MVDIKILIENCDDCPYAQIAKVYTSDSWDNVRQIYCNDQQKVVYKYLDWYDKSPVPSSCKYNKQ